MHHGAISVSLHVDIAALMGITPIDLQHKGASVESPLKSTEMAQGILCTVRVGKINKGVPERRHAFEVCRHVEEVVLSHESIGIEESAEIVVSGSRRHVLEDESRFSVRDLLGVTGTVEPKAPLLGIRLI